MFYTTNNKIKNKHIPKHYKYIEGYRIARVNTWTLYSRFIFIVLLDKQNNEITLQYNQNQDKWKIKNKEVTIEEKVLNKVIERARKICIKELEYMGFIKYVEDKNNWKQISAAYTYKIKLQ